MGAVLTQLTEQGEEHPILYLSKKFSEVEKRCCTTEKECASIVFAIKRLHYYLDGNSFLVMTDHNPLVWLNRNVSSNPRLMRWALALEPYNFRTVHRSEKHVYESKRKRKLDRTGASEMNRLYPNSRRESIEENKYLNTLPRRGGGWRKKRPNENETELGCKMDGDCKAKLAAGTVVEIEAGGSLFTDPISDVGKCI
ncbi:transposon Tf2-9 polyprotein [Trichonephila clavipes]|nr:transposon Tf2-9 polyprotein [Trichonephila clavipes]